MQGCVVVYCQVLEEQLKTIVVDHDATQKQRQEEVTVICECRVLLAIAIRFTVDYHCCSLNFC